MRNLQALLEKATRLQHITDHMFDLVALADPNGNFTFMSKSHECLGYQPEELIGEPVTVLVHPDDIPLVTRELNRFLQSGKNSQPVKYRCRCKNGNFLWLETMGKIIYDEAGEVRELLFSSRDISQRIQQEESIRNQNALIRALINSIPDPIFYKDLHGIYLGGNTTYATYMGMPLESIIGKTDYDLYPKKQADLHRTYDAKALRSSTGHRNEEWITYPDGRKTLVDVLKTPYKDHQGTIIGILGIARDITGLKKTEENLLEFNSLLELKNLELEQAMQLAHTANEAKSRYLAHMNHEMRTPLNGFIGFLQLMEKTDMTEEQKEFMGHMKHSASHMLSIISNVLDYARIEAREIHLEKQPFYPAEEIRMAIAPLIALAQEKSLLLHSDLPNNLPRQVWGDPQRLRQIILNIGGNAIKFTRKGKVSLSISCLESSEDHHLFQLVVEDTGPGMTEEALNKLFQPFYQGDDGSFRQTSGTGLGLPITKELVELMDGTIQVFSTPGKGTRVETVLKVGAFPS
ncbi:PAS domain-containing hybrid sensor histidine kinase/response regulator [Tindallia californiensis]|uniref:Circadian input-output histidine kinase CikA n=1 Tax=Tindallia californiensis TaxID=159292 RepID=A0A1H3LNG0_9FIRM|nr:PAS domain-containing hybrid sensor histidine kinase/response regulator [Tindallia californiensis]SDY65903.1 two-component system, NarL family, sensor histidine kinase EvgS [Tindallia californiensis]